ncbi:FecR family protein [Pedobacter psychroterrae]|uniref:DUF4974 domain-containing protein n=1 Tax=Pedobacter psychroterrae TaxID=2530453 RepID=A0A4R0NQ93_9SPHI|nr:FecR family protein [Pedobacter psychroterrae]TCD03181.1 DUF4974 domain-containing protein [Pedobacter psychroterrae]
MGSVYIRELIRKYNNEEASAAERLIVETWYDNLNSTGVFNDENANSQKMEQMEARLLARIDKGPIVRRIPFSYSKLIAFAAAIIVLISISVLFLHNYSMNSVNVAKKNVIVPGANKAFLVLGNGKRIDLDSTSTGLIAKSAGVAINVGATGKIVYNGRANVVEMNSLSTPKGGMYQVVLPDGSTVMLNSSSVLTFPNLFKGDSRSVKLSGEGYFEVAENKDQPFYVEANGVNIRVYGTGFNVMAYPEEQFVKTTLVHGSVRVGNNSVMSMLLPGQQALMDAKEKKIQIRRPSLEEVLAWKNWEFRFEGADITAILRQISRWYDVDVIYKGAVSDHRFYGVIPKKSNANDLFEILEETRQVHFEIQGRKVIVINGPREEKNNQ